MRRNVTNYFFNPLFGSSLTRLVDPTSAMAMAKQPRKLLTYLAWSAICTVLVLVIGSLLHFVYEWANEHAAIAWLGATNESVWEHMKLLMYPHLLGTLLIFLVGARERERVRAFRRV